MTLNFVFSKLVVKHLSESINKKTIKSTTFLSQNTKRKF
jgi:hypothetical protein